MKSIIEKHQYSYARIKILQNINEFRIIFFLICFRLWFQRLKKSKSVFFLIKKIYKKAAGLAAAGYAVRYVSG